MTRTNIFSFAPFAGTAGHGPGHPATRRSLSRLRAKLAERRQQRLLRRHYRDMLALDDHILKDIGITRGDVSWASTLPLNVDADEALRENLHRYDAA